MIDWLSFLQVFVASLVAACFVVTAFSFALRLGDGEAAWRRPLAIGLYVICGLAVLFGIWIIAFAP